MLLAKEAHLAHAVAELERREESSDQGVDGDGQHEGEEQREREQRDQDDARRAELPVLAQDRDLEDRGDEEHDGGLDAVHHRFGTITITDCSDEKSTSGSTWMFLNGFTSLLL